MHSEITYARRALRTWISSHLSKSRSWEVGTWPSVVWMSHRFFFPWHWDGTLSTEVVGLGVCAFSCTCTHTHMWTHMHPRDHTCTHVIAHARGHSGIPLSCLTPAGFENNVLLPLGGWEKLVRLGVPLRSGHKETSHGLLPHNSPSVKSAMLCFGLESLVCWAQQPRSWLITATRVAQLSEQDWPISPLFTLLCQKSHRCESSAYTEPHGNLKRLVERMAESNSPPE